MSDFRFVIEKEVRKGRHGVTTTYAIYCSSCGSKISTTTATLTDTIRDDANKFKAFLKFCVPDSCDKHLQECNTRARMKLGDLCE